MESIKDLAIVLRSTQFQDRHLIVTALTQNHGRISAMARNAVQSRRFGGTLAPFTASEWIFSQRPGNELATLQQTEIKRAFQGLSKDLMRLSLASACNELCLRILTHSQVVPELFKLHSHALALIEETTDIPSLLPIFNSVLMKWLIWSGHRPRFEACLRCGTAFQLLDALFADPTQGGWLCSSCCTSQTSPNCCFTRNLWIDAVNGSHLPLRHILEHRVASVQEHMMLYEYLKQSMAFHISGLNTFLQSLTHAPWEDFSEPFDSRSTRPLPTDPLLQNLRPSV